MCVSLQSSYLFQPAGSATVPVLLHAVWEDAYCRGGDQHLRAGISPAHFFHQTGHPPVKDWSCTGNCKRDRKRHVRIRSRCLGLIYTGSCFRTEPDDKLHLHVFHTCLVTYTSTCVTWPVRTHTAFGTRLITARDPSKFIKKITTVFSASGLRPCRTLWTLDVSRNLQTLLDCAL